MPLTSHIYINNDFSNLWYHNDFDLWPKKGYKYGEGFPPDRTVPKSIYLIIALKKTQRKRKTQSQFF